MPNCLFRVTMTQSSTPDGVWIMLTDIFVAIGAAVLISFSVWLFVFEPRRDIHDL